MRNTKRSILGLAAVAAGCASLLAASPAFATEQAAATPLIKAVMITQDAEMADTTEAVMLTVTTSSYDELAKEGIVSEETVKKMNEYAEKQSVQINLDLDQLNGMTDDEQKEYLASQAGSLTFGGLDEMVTEGIITQAEKDNIDQYYAKQVADGTMAEAVMMESAIVVETAQTE